MLFVKLQFKKEDNFMAQLSKHDYILSNECFRKELITIALPVALQNLMLALVGASDAIILGRFS